MAAALGAGLVAPDVRAGMGGVGEVANFCNVARRFVGRVVARRPLELVGTDHAIGHAAA